MPAKNAVLRFRTYAGRPFASVTLYCNGSPKLLLKQSQITSKVLALAELPSPEEWRKIRQIAVRSNLPSIWRRSQPSPLENLAAAVFAALVFASRKNRLHIVAKVLKRFRWAIKISGRPTIDKRDKARAETKRGIVLDKMIKRLRAGFHLKKTLRTSLGSEKARGLLKVRLKDRGYSENEIKTILAARTVQDAACRLYEMNPPDAHVSLQTIRNCYSRYKRFRAAFPPIVRTCRRRSSH